MTSQHLEMDGVCEALSSLREWNVEPFRSTLHFDKSLKNSPMQLTKTDVLQDLGSEWVKKTASTWLTELDLELQEVHVLDFTHLRELLLCSCGFTANFKRRAANLKRHGRLRNAKLFSQNSIWRAELTAEECLEWFLSLWRFFFWIELTQRKNLFLFLWRKIWLSLPYLHIFDKNSYFI